MSDTDHPSESQVLHGHAHPAMYTHSHGHSHGMPHAHMSSHHHVHMHDMHMRAQVEGDVQREAQGHLDHGHMQLRYLHPHNGHPHREENGLGDEAEDDAGEDEGLEEAEMNSDGGHHGDPQSTLAVRAQGTNQLTLSYQGEVYVFDTVPPEKVQAVLLLLGGREVPLGMPGVPMQGHHQHKALSDLPQRMNMPQRLASLTRFREKRKERNFDKKIRYTVRKEVALRMQRNKGQFASSKSPNDEKAVVSNWESSQPWNNQQVTSNSQEEAICLHCGTGERSTPMMRRGPNGPRTLCNACGLMWANKGVLRDLSKGPSIPGTSMQPGTLQQHPLQLPLQPQPSSGNQRVDEHHSDGGMPLSGLATVNATG